MASPAHPSSGSRPAAAAVTAVATMATMATVVASKSTSNRPSVLARATEVSKHSHAAPAAPHVPSKSHGNGNGNGGGNGSKPRHAVSKKKKVKKKRRQAAPHAGSPAASSPAVFDAKGRGGRHHGSGSNSSPAPSGGSVRRAKRTRIDRLKLSPEERQAAELKKREDRARRNRASALKSRNKRRNQLETLEARCSELEARLGSLEKENSKLLRRGGRRRYRAPHSSAVSEHTSLHQDTSTLYSNGFLRHGYLGPQDDDVRRSASAALAAHDRNGDAGSHHDPTELSGRSRESSLESYGSASDPVTSGSGGGPRRRSRSGSGGSSGAMTSDAYTKMVQEAEAEIQQLKHRKAEAAAAVGRAEAAGEETDKASSVVAALHTQLLDMKKKTRALKNKASAMRCREKKRRQMEQLQQKVDGLFDRVQHLVRENELLRGGGRDYGDAEEEEEDDDDAGSGGGEEEDANGEEDGDGAREGQFTVEHGGGGEPGHQHHNLLRHHRRRQQHQHQHQPGFDGQHQRVSGAGVRGGIAATATPSPLLNIRIAPPSGGRPADGNYLAAAAAAHDAAQARALLEQTQQQPGQEVGGAHPQQRVYPQPFQRQHQHQHQHQQFPRHFANLQSSGRTCRSAAAVSQANWSWPSQTSRALGSGTSTADGRDVKPENRQAAERLLWLMSRRPGL